MSTLIRAAIALSITSLLCSGIAFGQNPPLTIKDEGAQQGLPAFELDCVGSGISCSHSGITGTITVSGSHGDGANCAAGEIPLGVDANGAVQGCYEPSEADITDLVHTTDTSCTLNACTISTDDTVTLEQGLTPSNAAEGRIQWDTDDNRIVVGDGTGTQTFYPNAHTTDTTCSSAACTVGADDTIQYANDSYIQFRNFANSAWIDAIKMSTSDELTFYSPTEFNYQISTYNPVRFYVTGTDDYYWNYPGDIGWNASGTTTIGGVTGLVLDSSSGTVNIGGGDFLVSANAFQYAGLTNLYSNTSDGTDTGGFRIHGGGSFAGVARGAYMSINGNEGAAGLGTIDYYAGNVSTGGHDFFTANSVMQWRIDNAGDLIDQAGNTIIFEGATADAFETTLTVTDPTADRTLTLPNVTGTLLTSGEIDTAAEFDAIVTDGALSDDDLTDDTISTLSDVTGWSNYSGSIGSGCGGSCTAWSPTWDYVYGKNEGGLCTITARSNSAAPSTAPASYLLINTLPWSPADYGGTGQHITCGIGYAGAGANNYEAFAWAIDNTDEIRIYQQDFSTFSNASSWNVNFTCVYYCATP